MTNHAGLSRSAKESLRHKPSGISGMSASGGSSVSARHAHSQSDIPDDLASDYSLLTPGRAVERKRTFLLVDDAVSNCKMLKMLLTKRGIECHVANNGLEGVKAYRQSVASRGDQGAKSVLIFDVIVLDFTMPVMGGEQAARTLRAEGFTGLIVGLSGNTLEEDVNIFLAAGADCVFSKPFREESLSQLMGFLNDFGCESTPLTRRAIRQSMQQDQIG